MSEIEISGLWSWVDDEFLPNVKRNKIKNNNDKKRAHFESLLRKGCISKIRANIFQT